MVILDTKNLTHGYFGLSILGEIYVGEIRVWPPAKQITLDIISNFPNNMYATLHIPGKSGDPGENGNYVIYDSGRSIEDVNSDTSFYMTVHRNSQPLSGNITLNGRTYTLGTTKYLYYYGTYNSNIVTLEIEMDSL
jgi:hypothetical protein